jgi:membrane associated rhomboid family serine protease
LNVFIFLIEVFAGSGRNDIISNFGVIPFRFVGNWSSSLHELLTPVTAMFLHGGWLHIISNMLYLYIFGDNVEDALGHGKYLAFYLICGFISFQAQIFINTASMVPNIGASGAVAGVLGAYLLLYPQARVVTLLPLFVIFTMVEIPAFFFLGLWFFMQLAGGTAQLGNQNPFSGGIAFWAHIGGFIAGVVLIRLFLPKWRMKVPRRRL